MLDNLFPEIDGIHAIPLPFPAVSDLVSANVFALGEGPFTLIDAGPKTPESMKALMAGLKKAQLQFHDLERIIITHGHEDHYGMTALLSKKAGRKVECYIHPEDAWRVSRENEGKALWFEKLEELKEWVGMPRKEFEGVKRRLAFFGQMSDPIDNPSLMEDGDEFVGEGYHLRVIHTPGHTAGNCSLYELDRKILFSGDHILKGLTPNPIMEINRENLRNPEYKSLVAFQDSLGKLAGLDIDLVLPGHGEYIEDLQGILTSYRAHHRERMDTVWRAIKHKAVPLYHLVRDVFPSMPEEDLILALSEIIVHLEVLIVEGRAELMDPGPPALYRAL